MSAGVELSIKWPNDLMAAGPGDDHELKLAGILSEVVSSPRAVSRFPAVVVGIGINVNWPPDWSSTDARDPELASIAAHASALNRLAGREIDRDELVAKLLNSRGRSEHPPRE